MLRVGRQLEGCLDAKALNTTFNGNKDSYLFAGIMFTLETKATAIDVTTLELDVELNLAEDLRVEVYSYPGTYDVLMRNPMPWQKLADTEAVANPSGGGVLIPVQDFDTASFRSNKLYSLYVTLRGQWLDSNAYALHKTGELAGDYEHFKLNVGTGLNSRFALVDKTVPPKFAGVIHYDVKAECETPATTAETVVEYGFLIDDDGTDDTVLKTISNTVLQVLDSEIYENGSSSMGDYVSNHGLEKVGPPSSTRKTTDSVECSPYFHHCMGVETTMAFKHDVSLDQGELLFQLYGAIADRITLRVQKTLDKNMSYAGKHAALATFKFEIRGSPMNTEMNLAQKGFFQEYIKQFVAGNRKDFIYSVSVEQQSLNRRTLEAGAVRIPALEVTGEIRGTQYSYSPYTQFAEDIELALENDKRLAELLAFDVIRPSSSLNALDASFFRGISGMDSAIEASVITLSPATAATSPPAIQPPESADDGGHIGGDAGDAIDDASDKVKEGAGKAVNGLIDEAEKVDSRTWILAGSIAAVVVIILVTSCILWCLYYRKKKKTSKDFTVRDPENSPTKKEGSRRPDTVVSSAEARRKQENISRPRSSSFDKKVQSQSHSPIQKGTQRDVMNTFPRGYVAPKAETRRRDTEEMDAPSASQPSSSHTTSRDARIAYRSRARSFDERVQSKKRTPMTAEMRSQSMENCPHRDPAQNGRQFARKRSNSFGDPCHPSGAPRRSQSQGTLRAQTPATPKSATQPIGVVETQQYVTPTQVPHPLGSPRRSVSDSQAQERFRPRPPGRQVSENGQPLSRHIGSTCHTPPRREGEATPRRPFSSNSEHNRSQRASPRRQVSDAGPQLKGKPSPSLAGQANQAQRPMGSPRRTVSDNFVHGQPRRASPRRQVSGTGPQTRGQTLPNPMGPASQAQRPITSPRRTASGNFTQRNSQQAPPRRQASGTEPQVRGIPASQAPSAMGSPRRSISNNVAQREPQGAPPIRQISGTGPQVRGDSASQATSSPKRSVANNIAQRQAQGVTPRQQVASTGPEVRRQPPSTPSTSLMSPLERPLSSTATPMRSPKRAVSSDATSTVLEQKTVADDEVQLKMQPPTTPLESPGSSIAGNT